MYAYKGLCLTGNCYVRKQMCGCKMLKGCTYIGDIFFKILMLFMDQSKRQPVKCQRVICNILLRIIMLNLVALLLLATPSAALLTVGMTVYLEYLQPQFMTFTESGQCAPSFECDIIMSVCEKLDEDCVIIPLDSLDDRFGAIERQEVDVTISLSSVSPERAERVHFVRPHYYYAGAMIFVLDTVPDSEHPEWSDLQGANVCVLEDYYAISALQFLYEPTIIEYVTLDLDLLVNGTCDYFVSDNTDLVNGTVASTNTLIEFGAPFAIAVAHEEKDGLGQEISDALVDMMDDGLESEILQIEQTHLVDFGFPQNVKLTDIVLAITDRGEALPPEVEDAIWDE
eukprot:TRINITY_DN40984_c6_g1_i1.p1 TRINITY_DN40984_c6_g1~~TRINITY_DN40984_c6_g1_i1.p1  ORF type:complete len:341 (-),score=34.10 TRINITY_DN40984_c6_g1_i1:176-1198(-)